MTLVYHPSVPIRLTTALSIFIAGCNLNFDVASGAQISCTANADCPHGSRCLVTYHRCADSAGGDTTPPALLSHGIAPSAGGANTTFTESLLVSESLIAPPLLLVDAAASDFVLASRTPLPGGAESYAFTLLPTALADGSHAVTASFADHSGNTVTVTLDSFRVDTSIPSIDPSLLVVVSSPPGSVDSVAGAAGASNAGARIDLYADEALTTLRRRLTCEATAAFSLSLGDNGVDELAGVSTGQARYFLLATNAAGNVSGPVPVDTVLAPPEVTASTVQRYGLDPLTVTPSWIDTSEVGIGDVRVFIQTPTPLSQPPVVNVQRTPPLIVGCAVSDVSKGEYLCPFDVGGWVEGEAPDIQVVLRGAIGGNVALRDVGTLTINQQPPARIDPLPKHISSRTRSERRTSSRLIPEPLHRGPRWYSCTLFHSLAGAASLAIWRSRLMPVVRRSRRLVSATTSSPTSFSRRSTEQETTIAPDASAAKASC